MLFLISIVIGTFVSLMKIVITTKQFGSFTIFCRQHRNVCVFFFFPFGKDRRVRRSIHSPLWVGTNKHEAILLPPNFFFLSSPSTCNFFLLSLLIDTFRHNMNNDFYREYHDLFVYLFFVSVDNTTKNHFTFFSLSSLCCFIKSLEKYIVRNSNENVLFRKAFIGR